MRWRVLILLVALTSVGTLAHAAGQAGTIRLKDITTLDGPRGVPLIGYGLVVGLNKTGDRRQTIFSAQTLANMLDRFGVAVAPGQIKVENVAAVLVTGDLPPFARAGGRIDVTVSSIGDARSLQGGTLLATPLRGPNGSTHVLAQGVLSIGGYGGGKGGNSVQVNHLTVGRVPDGGAVQIGLGQTMSVGPSITLSLKEPDYVTASHVARAINTELGPSSARAIDPATITVVVPSEYQNAVADLMARLEPLTVTVDTAARVVVNERTGTVVVGADVRLGAAAVAHGNLSVRISTQYKVSQPTEFSQGGKTAVVPEEKVDVTEGQKQLVAMPEGTTLDAVVRALNALGASPRDIVAIMQALKAAGALRAELVII
jgi:flagellar P-ring protein precursor FlgI